MTSSHSDSCCCSSCSSLATLPSDAAIVTVNATVLRIVDGDTIHVQANLWPRHQWQGNIRLHGIDTPELHGQCQAEREQAVLAKETLRSLVPPDVRLVNVKPGKFTGRFVAAVMDGNRDFADMLMENGVDQPYVTGKRKLWCNESRDSIRDRAGRMRPSEDTDTPADATSKAYLRVLLENL